MHAPRRALAARSSVELQGPVRRIEALAEAMSERVRSQPATSLATALAIGFLVGGALSFRVGRIFLAAAARRLSRELLKQVL
jgi:hypothetical protein